MSNLKDFLIYDDRSRWGAIGWIIAVAGTFGSVQLVFLGVSIDDAALSMGIIIALLSICFIGWYCSFGRHRNVGSSPSRRSLLVQAVTGLAGVSLGVSLLRSQIATSETALQRVSADPTNPRNIEQAQKVLTGAKSAQTYIAPTVLEAAGKQLIAASESNPAAWKTALELLSYKSSVNRSSPADSGSVVAKGMTHYFFQTPPGSEEPQMYFKGMSLHSTGAQFKKIGDEPDKDSSVGIEYFVPVGGTEILDGMQLRNVVFQGVHIIYNGGPIRTTNVFFINCTFEMHSAKNTQDFASAILEPNPAVTFFGE